MLFATYAWFMHGFIYYCPSTRLSWVHLYLMPVTWASSLLIFFISSGSSPGQITKKNVKEYLKGAEFDPFVHKEENECKICGIKRVPRSKHCRLCGFCVPMIDHHCVWINACVGEKNYKLFLMFLGIHMVWTTYGFVLSVFAFWEVIDSEHLLTATFMDKEGNKYTADYMIVAQYLLEAHSPMMFGALIYLVCSVLLILFNIYHHYLVYLNSTTADKMNTSKAQHFYST